MRLFKLVSVVVCLVCLGGEALGVERPFVLWDKGDIAGIRERIERQGWAKAAYEKLKAEPGRHEGMANSYGNLRLIYRRRGDLDKAEEMFEKILKIHKQTGNKEGMASDYANLGAVYEQRGDIVRAREYWQKALRLYEKIGMPHMVERVEGWIEGLS